MYKFLYEHVFKSLYHITISEIARSYDNSVLNFLRNCQTAFYSGCIILQSHQQCMRVLINF